MTDRYQALTVILKDDIREDDAEAVIQAIAMVKGVMKVEPHVSDYHQVVAEARVKREVIDRLYQLIEEL